LERQRVRSDAENGFNLPDFRSKVAFLHHRQQVCAAGGKLGETSPSGGHVTVEWWDVGRHPVVVMSLLALLNGGMLVSNAEIVFS